MKKVIKSILAAAVVTGMVIPLTACSSKDKGSNAGSSGSNSGNTNTSIAGAIKPKAGKARIVSDTDPYFNVTEAELKVKVPEGKEILYTEFTNTYAVGDRILANVHMRLKMPVEVEKEMNSLNLDLEKDAEKYQQIFDEYNRNSFQLFDLDGNNISAIETETGAEFTGAFALENGEILVVTSKTNYQTCASEPKLFVISTTGEKARDIPLSVNEPLTDTHVYLTGNGNLLLASSRKYYLLDSQGKVLKMVEDPRLSGQMLCSDGKWYACMPDYNLGDSNMALQEVDTNEGSLIGKPLSIDMLMSYSLTQGKKNCFLINNNGVEKYDLLDGSRTAAFTWKDTDVNFTSLDFSGASIESEDKMIFFKTVTNAESARTDMDQKAGVGNRAYVVTLTRADKNPHAGKEIIKLGVNGIKDEAFLNQIITFNTDPNQKARIEICDYATDSDFIFDEQSSLEKLQENADKLTMDMLSGEGPDILVGYSGLSQFNTENTLLDLKQYLDNDSNLNKEDYYANIFSAFETDGKLFSIPITFSLEGILIDSKIQGAKDKLSFADLDTMASSLSADKQMFSGQDWKSLLSKWIKGMGSTLIDNTNQKVNFDSDEFRALLQAIKKHGVSSSSSANSSMSGPALAEGNMNDDLQFFMGMIVACNSQLSGLDDFSMFGSFGAGINNGDILFSGYPTANGTGMLANGEITMSITSSAANPDLAWDFIRSFLSEDSQYDLSFSTNKIPVNKKAFNKKCNLEIKLNNDYVDNMKKSSLDTDYIPYRYSQKDVDTFESIIASVQFTSQMDSAVLNIVMEEAAGFFEGNRSIDEVCKNIQNRASLIVQER